MLAEAGDGGGTQLVHAGLEDAEHVEDVLDEFAVAGGQPGLHADELLGVLGGVTGVEHLRPQQVVPLKVGVELAQDLMLQAQDPPFDGRQVDWMGAGPLDCPAGQLVDQGPQEVGDRGASAGLPADDQAATCRSGREVGAEGELELVGGQRISPLLVAGEGLIGRLVPGQGLVDGVREQVGGQQGPDLGGWVGPANLPAADPSRLPGTGDHGRRAGAGGVRGHAADRGPVPEVAAQPPPPGGLGRLLGRHRAALDQARLAAKIACTGHRTELALPFGRDDGTTLGRVAEALLLKALYQGGQGVVCGSRWAAV